MGGIYFDMIFVAIIVLAVLAYPTGIGIFLTFIIVCPDFENLAHFNLSVLMPTVALMGCSSNTGVDNLTFFHHKPIFPEKTAKLLKDHLNQPRFGQLFAEQPDSLGIRHSIAQYPRPRNRIKDNQSQI